MQLIFNRRAGVSHPSLFSVIECFRSDHQDRLSELDYFVRFRVSHRKPKAKDVAFNAFLLSVWEKPMQPMQMLFTIVRKDLSQFSDDLDDADE